MKQIWPLLMLASVLTAACDQQPLPEVVTGEPVFSFTGTIDGNEVVWIAGEEGNYQQIGLEQNEEGLYVFSGNIGPRDCEDCPRQIGIAFRHSDFAEPGGIVSETDAPGIGSYPFYQQSKMERLAQVELAWDGDGAEPAGISWDLGDGATSLALNPVHVYKDTTLETVTVCMQTRDASGCVTSICNLINLKDTACQAAFQFEIDPSVQFVTFRDKSKGALPMRYKWSFGDGYSATLGNPGYYYPQSGRYDACLEIEDASGCKSEICKEISPDLSTCTAGFNYEVSRIDHASPGQLGSFSLVWLDDDGQAFRSDLTAQDASAYCEVVSASRYQEDQNGLAAWQVTFRVKALLTDESGRQVPIEGEGTMAIGIPLEQ